ncbi:hypothetical protein ACO11K_000003 [Bacillus cytotoxicus]|uniref:hypothetical protein n=1 Tax=Bacillus cereus group sp. BfR-BA-01492 TaxID=2920361 RepID=UPI001F584D00|nr:hypothetical protein [Bacillus cereus group sp. BfR-BA-01492]EMA6344733.1 hypothetical protein [Bacillus cytotoxicus]
MQLILKAENKLLNIDNAIYIENIFNKSVTKIKVNESIDDARLQKMMYEGIEINKLKDWDSEEGKVLISIFKSVPEKFLLSKDTKVLSKELNIRNVFLLCEQTGTPIEDLLNYRESLENTCIYILGDKNNLLSTILENNGFHVVDTIENVNKRIIGVVEKEFLNFDPDMLDGFDCILPYSVTEMTLGPCIFSLAEFPKEQLETNIRKSSDSQVIPSYANMLTIYSLLINNLVFLINNTHQKLYVDAALPINRFFHFKLPDMKLVAKTVF